METLVRLASSAGACAACLETPGKAGREDSACQEEAAAGPSAVLGVPA